MAESIESGPIAWFLANQPQLWLVAVVFFGIGDLVTTIIGYAGEGIVEVGPVVGPIIQQYGLIAMIGLKILTFGGCYLIATIVPRPQNVGVPLGLAVFGILVTAWNLLVLIIAPL